MEHSSTHRRDGNGHQHTRATNTHHGPRTHNTRAPTSTTSYAQPLLFPPGEPLQRLPALPTPTFPPMPRPSQPAPHHTTAHAATASPSHTPSPRHNHATSNNSPTTTTPPHGFNPTAQLPHDFVRTPEHWDNGQVFGLNLPRHIQPTAHSTRNRTAGLPIESIPLLAFLRHSWSSHWLRYIASLRMDMSHTSCAPSTSMKRSLPLNYWACYVPDTSILIRPRLLIAGKKNLLSQKDQPSHSWSRNW